MFGPGDMVLTPNDTWHNHGTVGNEQALNLSVLDLPLVETLNAIHFDHDYKEDGERQARRRRSSRPRAFRPTTRSASMAMAGCCRALPASRCAAPASRRRCSSIAGTWCANCWTSTRTGDGDPHDAPDGRIYRSDHRPAGIQDHHLLRANAAARARRRYRCGRRRACWSRRSKARAIRSSMASGSTGTSSIRSPFRAAPGSSMSTTSDKEPLFLFVASDEPTLEEARPLQEMGPRSASGDDRVASRLMLSDGLAARVAIARQRFTSTRHVPASVQYHARFAHRLPRRRTSLGRGHDPLCRPHAADQRHDHHRCRRSAQAAIFATHRCAGGLAFAQGAGRRRHHDRQPGAVRQIGPDDIGGGIDIYDVSKPALAETDQQNGAP